MPYVTREDDISALPLSNRSQNCLKRTHIKTIGELLDYPEDELISIRNMGIRSVDEIKGIVSALKNGLGEYILVEHMPIVEERPAFAESSIIHEVINSDGAVTILFDELGNVVQDIPIEELELSVRSQNCLIRGGYLLASQLLGITYDDLMRIRNMGSKSAEEVLSYVEKISTHYKVNQIDAVDESSNSFPLEMLAVYGKEESVWVRELLTVKAQFPEAVGETLIYRLYESTYVHQTIKETILKIVEENNNEISKKILEDRLPQHLNNTTILEEVLLELESVFAIELGEVMIRRQYPSIVDFAAKIENERIREVIQSRVKGKTLSEIGDEYGISRERVRQLTEKGLRKRPRLREDKYIYIYDNYDFSYEDFKLAFDEPTETYYYLEMVCRTAHYQKKPIDEILTDVNVSTEYRKKAERAIYKQYVSTDGVRVKMTRADLVKHYVKTFCRALTKFEDFFEQYHLWLELLGINDNTSLSIDSGTYNNILNQCNYVLWNQKKSFRYYNISDNDFEELLTTLNLEQFEDTEFSTLKLFRDYSLLMKQYDIQDEYELHNLLKKIWPAENDIVKFKKMPTIEVGSGNPTKQAFNLLLQYAPISGDDFANRYEEEYGAKAATVRGGLLRELDHYYYRGVYSVDYTAMPTIQFNRMKSILGRDFYTVQEVKRLYKREFPNSEDSLINPYTLKTLGYHVFAGYSGYVIKNTYSSATDYFHTILTQDDIVDIREYENAIRSMATYDSECRRLRNAYEIIEFSPLQYINIRRLNEVGVTKDHLKEYCNVISKRYEKGEYFTVTSLRNDGFTHSMDDLGFEEWFYSSVLFEDRENFSAQRIGGTRIFLRGKPNGNFNDMLVWLLGKYQKIDFYDLLDLLKNQYGISLPKDKVVEMIKSTELYYDTIMEAVYIDYDTYFEEF